MLKKIRVELEIDAEQKVATNLKGAAGCIGGGAGGTQDVGARGQTIETVVAEAVRVGAGHRDAGRVEGLELDSGQEPTAGGGDAAGHAELGHELEVDPGDRG